MNCAACSDILWCKFYGARTTDLPAACPAFEKLVKVEAEVERLRDELSGQDCYNPIPNNKEKWNDPDELLCGYCPQCEARKALDGDK